MNFVIPAFFLFSSLALARSPEVCPGPHKNKVFKLSKRLCEDHLSEFARRSNASCKIKEHDLSACRGECLDETLEKFAEVRVKLSTDCGREQVFYNRTNIKYYR